jgi:hypothetical protein
LIVVYQTKTTKDIEHQRISQADQLSVDTAFQENTESFLSQSSILTNDSNNESLINILLKYFKEKLEYETGQYKEKCKYVRCQY